MTPTPPPFRAMTTRELAFIREVLIPRAWVHGAEVDELVRLRQKIREIFAGLTAEGDRREAAASAEEQAS